ncbi:isochorismate synthase [Vibrio sp. SM6]|uniref:Isochorismate synthase MenF n=2 Tax=Vibrio agarilyticus TaxID=2726741 RepID=A0A7X8TRY5_9VIBR|nr:isochorismate synthase [Vibrio agarilyticus]
MPLSCPPFELIDWLAAQEVYPQCYWQSRDGSEEVAALGQLRMFSELTPAYEVLSAGQRVWGGRSFDGGTDKNPQHEAAFFFLPLIELMRTGAKESAQWHCVVNLSPDRQAQITALQQLNWAPKSLLAIKLQIRHLEHTPSQAQWHQLVNDALIEIEQENFKKVVLARQSTVTLDSPLLAAQLVKASVNANHNSFHFMLRFDPQYAFVGSTPERLYIRERAGLKTEALAGTIGRGQSAYDDAALGQWLSQDEKNINENQYVVDDILASLHPLVECIHVDSATQLVQLRQVQHLKRDITAQLKPDANGTHLLGALQPTAAVCGLPRPKAMNYILHHEPFCRGWYAGSIGYISADKAEFCVAIRSAEVENNQVRLYAGAGIVPGSQADLEWLELEKKVATLLTLLGDVPTDFPAAELRQGVHDEP